MTDRARPLRVLQSTPPPGRQTNPYITQLHSALRAEGVDVVLFSWRTALLGRYDVLHTHWPENLVRGTSPRRTLVRQVLAAALVLRLVITRAPVVRTLHNLRPHEPLTSSRARLLLLSLEARERWWIRLNETTEVRDPERAVTALHGDYTAWAAGRFVPPPVPGRLLTPGVVRSYKGTAELVEAFAQVEDPRASLVILGRSDDPGLTHDLRQRAGSDPRVLLRLHHADDDELAAAVGEAQLVVLPYRQIHNSGVLLLALSLGRPVLVPRAPATEELAERVGPGWVLLGDMTGATGTAASLTAALDRTAALPEGRPDLSAHAWSAVAAVHLALYRRAVRRPGARASRRRRA